jgi:hypothetical protein
VKVVSDDILCLASECVSGRGLAPRRLGFDAGAVIVDFVTDVVALVHFGCPPPPPRYDSTNAHSSIVEVA